MECPVCGAYGWKKDEICERPAGPGGISATMVIRFECLRCGYEKPAPTEVAVAQD